MSNVWSIATIILISLYTAKLLSMLRAERMKRAIESADDLVKQREVKYGIVQSGSTAEFFRVGSFLSLSSKLVYMIIITIFKIQTDM